MQVAQVPHQPNHDLEAFFWVIWMICINVDSPFNHHCQWKYPLPTNSLAGSASHHSGPNSTQGSQSWPNEERDPREHQAIVPDWAKPGFHALDAAAIFAGKSNMAPIVIGTVLSPYFVWHQAVSQGLQKMHSLFQWQANVNNDSRDPGLCP